MREGHDFSWENVKQVESSDIFTCGYCGNLASSNRGFVGWHRGPGGSNFSEEIFICHSCGNPTFFDFKNKQYPGPLMPEIPGVIDELISGMYEEARKSMSAGAYTAAIMCCRNLLAYIAVVDGAKKGLSFVDYVDYLDANGYIPKKGKAWVNEIRKKGNGAAHDIILFSEADAMQIMKFSEFLLKANYEYPSYVTPKGTS
jgi:hypothetical protein